MEALKERMEESRRKAALNRDIAMDKHKLFYDRKIKKFSFIIVDYVLCDHPISKRGLAWKYYGPFVICGITENKVDYLIKRIGKNRGKVYQIHQNRLKTTFKHESLDENDESSSTEEPVTKKRNYTKDPTHPRSKRRNRKVSKPSSSEEKKSELLQTKIHWTIQGAS